MNVLQVDGTATLGGTLRVSDYNELGNVEKGQQFAILTANTVVGHFNKRVDYSKAPLPSGLYWHINYNQPGKVILEVVDIFGLFFSATEGASGSRRGCGCRGV